jgi:cyclopropane fatty-acyl-phospholipid synthase-like methyltransferase
MAGLSNGGELNRSVIQEYWKKISTTQSNRWTGEEMLAYDIKLVNELSKHPKSVLDLGSGSGDLSRCLISKETQLVAVDFEPNFARFFLDERMEFIPCEVLSYSTAMRFDLVLAFGLVTHFDSTEEEQLYRMISGTLDVNGMAIVKNQVSTGSEDLYFNGFSDKLSSTYSARYPSILSQEQLLRKSFRNVVVHRYPTKFQNHPETIHAAFSCWN